MKKRMMALILTLCLTAGYWNLQAFALDKTPWIDAVLSRPEGYVVEDNGQVTISSAEGLAWFAVQVNGGDTFQGKTVTLTQDIDVSAHAWVPIGAYAHPFQGTFDGSGHTISGMDLRAPASGQTCLGLFGFVQEGTLKNVTLRGAKVQASANEAGYLWAFGTLAGAVRSTEIDHVVVTEAAMDIDVQAAAFALFGGTVGLADFVASSKSALAPSRFTNCETEGLTVTYRGSADQHISTGGIVGGQGKVAADNSAIGIGSAVKFGGLATSLEHCVVRGFSLIRTADTSSNYEMMGGIVGYARSAGRMENCQTEGIDFRVKATVPTPSPGGSWSATAVYGIYGGGIAGALDGGMTVTACTSEGSMTTEVDGGFQVQMKDGTPVRGGFFGGIAGLIGSMPEKNGWGDLSYNGAGASIQSCYARLAFEGSKQESMRHASALYATGNTGASITVKDFFTSCTFAGAAYPDGLDYNYGYPLLGANAASSVKPTQSYQNIFLVEPAHLKAGEPAVPASYGAFYNGGWYGDSYFWDNFKGAAGSEFYQSAQAQPDGGGEKLTFAQGGVFTVQAKITKNDGTSIAFQFPVAVEGPSTFTVTAGAGAHGTVDPNGIVEVKAGASQTFTFTPDYGYQVADVQLDHGSIGARTSLELTDVQAEHTIDVQFTPIQYSITYQLDGGTVSAGNPTAYTIETPTFTLNNPTRSGYTFLGWMKNGDSALLDQVTIPTGTTGELQFTAHWKKNGSGGSSAQNYTLFYQTNGGSALASETKRYAWMKSQKDLPAPERKGYVFAGWYLDQELTERVTGDVKVNRSAVTLYAGWREDMPDPAQNGVSQWLNTVDHGAYLHGYDDGTFGPNRAMTRAETAQMFYNLLLDQQIPVTVHFEDVADNAWYAEAVNTLASLHILYGDGDDRFAPDRPVSRAEFTAIAMRFTEGENAGENIFSDVQTDDWFYASVVGSVQYGWIAGYADGTFRPDQSITRAEVTAIVNNMLGRCTDASFADLHSEKLRHFSDVPSTHWAYHQIVEATTPHTYVWDGQKEKWTAITEI